MKRTWLFKENAKTHTHTPNAFSLCWQRQKTMKFDFICGTKKKNCLTRIRNIYENIYFELLSFWIFLLLTFSAFPKRTRYLSGKKIYMNQDERRKRRRMRKKLFCFGFFFFRKSKRERPSFDLSYDFEEWIYDVFGEIKIKNINVWNKFFLHIDGIHCHPNIFQNL